ncbi:Carboxylesterase [Streptomyces sp. ADI96-02]|uniref:carboxylesterase/lipase family protein n=1 Tax=Streptomyces sp. ADI96-02 TaxID=1522760 RepID=UPI000F552573|nr:carboxylesterase family protein [Streptomyces sp. ADI96-02]RPK54997.1 Carboxylesterase [Streptomyces sp. ADI96-02]
MHVWTTTAGRVRGRRAERDAAVVAVLGIPYAAPPFGPDRFREPRPARPWVGTRDCTVFGPIAPQSAELPGSPVWSPGDEDILTLNVWAPADNPAGLPVLVWSHGGAYVFGSSAQPDFDGTALAARGLVVVTLNSRLGFEGFGHVPDADGGPARPDNRGLLDQIAALEWVRDNIAEFGGAPDRVTVAGQSSGAGSVACLMVMERARGLMRRAVLHSPVNSCAPVEHAARTTAEVAATAGVPATRAGLSAASPQALVAASDRVADRYRRDPASGQRHYDPAVYGPVADGTLLTADPLTALAAGAGGDVELLVCHTTEEYWLLDAVGSSAKVTTEDRLAVFAADFGLPAALVDGYRDRLAPAPVLDVYLALYSDLLFAEYGSRLAEAHAGSGGRAFLSRFDRRRGGRGQRVRAWHCADVPFAFGNLHDARLHFLTGGPPGDADRELSRRMMDAWTGFAAHGDPGWDPLDPGASDARPDAGAAVRVWRTAEEEEEAARQGGSRAGGFRDLWRASGLPLLTP